MISDPSQVTSTTAVGLTPPAVVPRPAKRAITPLPAAEGFARGVTGGGGGQVVHVWSADDDPTSPRVGTLRYALSVPGTRWIVFDQDMTIRFQAPMRVPSNTTIDGRGRNVLLTGHDVAGLQVYDARNVIIANLTMRDFGDIAMTKFNDPDDAIDIQRSELVWIDHSTFSVAGDKLIATAEGSKNITLSWNRFYEQEQNLQFGALYSAGQDVATTVTLHHNYFDTAGYRLPLVLYGKAHLYNNYLHEWKISAVRAERIAQVYSEGNYFQVGASRKATLIEPAATCNDLATLCDDRPGFLYDAGTNTYVGKAQTQSTTRETVFDPAQAYSYSAESATRELADRVAASAGARVLPQTPTPAATTTTVGLSMRARNLPRSLDRLTVTSARPDLTSTLRVKIYRLEKKRWSLVRETRMARGAGTTIAVRDRNGRRVSTYHAVITAQDRVSTSRTRQVRVR